MSATTKHETVIDGYRVELELYEERGEPRSDCFIFYPAKNDRFGASLSCAEGEGELASYRDGVTHEIDERTCERIRKWAEDNGY